VSEPEMFAWGRFKEDGRTDGRSLQSGVRPGSGNPVEQEDSRPRAPLRRCRSMMSRAIKRARRTGWFGSSNLLPSASVRNRARPPPCAPFDRNYITWGKGWWPVKVASEQRESFRDGQVLTNPRLDPKLITRHSSPSDARLLVDLVNLVGLEVCKRRDLARGPRDGQLIDFLGIAQAEGEGELDRR